MKKGEVQQVFIYLMVVLVVGTIFLVGYSVIGKIIPKTCDVERTSFITHLDNLLDDNSELGSFLNTPIKRPCDYDLLCFMSTTGISNPSSTIQNKVMLEEYNAESGNNVFLIRNKITEPIIAFEGLKVEDGYFCLESKGNQFYIKLEGKKRGEVTVYDTDPEKKGKDKGKMEI